MRVSRCRRPRLERLVTREAIDAALMAHVQWKKRLQEAIAMRASEFTPSVVRTDDACEFGKWLHGLPPEDTRTDDYRQVEALHARFHRIAGDTLELALAGKGDQALANLGGSAAYGDATRKLVLALQAWKTRL